MSGNEYEPDASSFSRARVALERERAFLNNAIERRSRTNRLYQIVTVATFGALIGANLLGTYAEIVKQNIGILDWLRSAAPASLAGTIGSLAVAVIALAFATYTYLDASAQEQARRALRVARAAFSQTEEDSFGPPAVPSHDLSGAVDQNSSATGTRRGHTEHEIVDIANRVSTELMSRSTEADSLRQIRALYETTQERLNAEINALNKRALLNLIIGSFVTVLAALVLVYVAVSDPLRDILATGSTRSLKWLELAAHYVPRLSIVIFLEVFAFFFLRLYKNTLAEVRLYQLDLTRVSTQASAVELVFTSCDGAERAATAAALINAEWSGPRATESSSPGLDPKLVGELASIAAKMASKTT